MPKKETKTSLSHTLKTFWSSQRFLMLAIFSLIAGNITLYSVSHFSRRQILNQTIAQQTKVYNAFLHHEAFSKPETENLSSTDSNESKLGAPGPKEDSNSTIPGHLLSLNPNQASMPGNPYNQALRDMRRQFPQFRIHLAIPGAVEGENDKRILDILKNRPKGWRLTDEEDGWARSYFILPTRGTAALQVVSYIRDEVLEWQSTAITLGVYSGLTLFFFGWFWTRALSGSVTDKIRSDKELEIFRHEVQTRLIAMHQITQEIGAVIQELHAGVEDTEKNIKQSQKDALQTLDELASQIRLLAVNGSIEAARDANSYRVFHVLMQEMNQLAEKSRELIKLLRTDFKSFDSLKQMLLKVDGVIAQMSEKPNASAFENEPSISSSADERFSGHSSG